MIDLGLEAEFSLPDPAKINDLRTDDARRLIDSLRVHLPLWGKAVHRRRLLGAEDGHLV